MVQISEIQAPPVSKYHGSTLEKVLHAICDANTTLTKTSTSLIERLNAALDDLRKHNADLRASMYLDATSALLFGVAEGAATIGGSAVSLIPPNTGASTATDVFGRVMYAVRQPETLRLIESGSKGAAPALQGAGRASSAIMGSRKTDIEFRTSLDNRSLSNAQDTNSTVERQRDALITSATAILNAKSRSSQ